MTNSKSRSNIIIHDTNGFVVKSKIVGGFGHNQRIFPIEHEQATKPRAKLARTIVQSSQVDNSPATIAHYASTPSELFSGYQFPPPATNFRPGRLIDMRFEEDELADMSAIFARAIAKGRLAEQEANKLHHLKERNSEEEFTEIEYAEEASNHIQSIAIGAKTLGLSIIILFIGLFISSELSGINFVHPIISIAFLISGVTFWSMSLPNAAE